MLKNAIIFTPRFFRAYFDKRRRTKLGVKGTKSAL